jgi:hypothetical protein
MASFYAQVVGSGIYDWLSEYSTPTRAIGRGSFVGTYQIGGRGGTVGDDDIRADLPAAIAAGQLPAPSADTIYMVHVPQGQTVTYQGYASCSVFCGYHDAVPYAGRNVYFAVLPDISACGGCAVASSVFASQMAVASHELVETVTDPEAAYWTATLPGAPLGWFDANRNQEIADICEGAPPQPFTGLDGYGYVAAQQWSNHANMCTTQCQDPHACFNKCGTLVDACGVTRSCPGCSSGYDTCGGGGTPNVCGCTPHPATCPHNQCGGGVPDGCGGLVPCHADCSIDGDVCGPCKNGSCYNNFCKCAAGSCL